MSDAAYREKNREWIRQKNFDARRNDPRHHMLYKAKSRAKKAGLPFDIDVNDLIIPNVCPYLKIPITIGDGRLHSGSPSLDRIIPELGYVKGNVQVISHLANTMKQNVSIDMLCTFALSVLELHQSSS